MWERGEEAEWARGGRWNCEKMADIFGGKVAVNRGIVFFFF